MEAAPFGQIIACGEGVGNPGNPLILQILVQTLLFHTSPGEGIRFN
jgi:hypothetical protein